MQMRNGAAVRRAAVAALLLGGGDVLGPDVGDVEGTYLLELVDGRPVENGESTLGLTPRTGETAALYGWSVRGAAYLPDGPADAYTAGDFGRWSLGGGRVRFRSQQGQGTYAAAPEPVTGGAPGGPRLTLSAPGGRRFTFRRLPRGGPQGVLDIAVTDAAGRQTGGAALVIRRPDGLVTRAGSTEYRTFLTSGPAGEWTVAAEPLPGFALAPGQPNPARVSVAARETTRLTIVVTATTGAR